jgi:hypothetical protein
LHISGPRELFAQLNDTLPPRKRWKKIGELSDPVGADIYERP